VRGHDNPAGDGAGEEHQNGRAPGAPSPRQASKADTSRSRTRRVVRRLDPWSVFKVSVIFYVAVYGILLVAAVLLWLAATATGLRDNVEQVIADLIASGKFHFVGSELLRAGAVGGAMLVVFGTAANVMLAVLYNLISDLVGGLSIVVEDRPVRAARTKKPARRAGPEPAPRPVPAPTKILIPEVERSQVRVPLGGAPARAEVPQDQLSAAEPAPRSGPEPILRSAMEPAPHPAPAPEPPTNLDAFGL
jgi:hypothetical protein